MRRTISQQAAELAQGVASTIIALAQRTGADPKRMREVGNRIDDGLREGDRCLVSSGLSSARSLIRNLMPHAQAPDVGTSASPWPWSRGTSRTIKQRQFKGRPHPASTCELSAGLDEVERAFAALG